MLPLPVQVLSLPRGQAQCGAMSKKHPAVPALCPDASPCLLLSSGNILDRRRERSPVSCRWDPVDAVTAMGAALGIPSLNLSFFSKLWRRAQQHPWCQGGGGGSCQTGVGAWGRLQGHPISTLWAASCAMHPPFLGCPRPYANLLESLWAHITWVTITCT